MVQPGQLRKQASHKLKRYRWRNRAGFVLGLLACLTWLAACGSATPTPAATPTVDPDIYNQVPKTTFFEPGQCTVVLSESTPAHTSNTLGAQAGGEIPAGEYQVELAADYGSSVWYALSGIDGANYINSTSVASTQGDCSTANN